MVWSCIWKRPRWRWRYKVIAQNLVDFEQLNAKCRVQNAKCKNTFFLNFFLIVLPLIISTVPAVISLLIKSSDQPASCSFGLINFALVSASLYPIITYPFTSQYPPFAGPILSNMPACFSFLMLTSMFFSAIPTFLDS